MNKARQWGYGDGYALRDMRGSMWFTTDNGLGHYNKAYADGVTDYIDSGDGTQLERAYQCAEAVVSILEAGNDEK